MTAFDWSLLVGAVVVVVAVLWPRKPPPPVAPRSPLGGVLERDATRPRAPSDPGFPPGSPTES